jgi:TetR/AcrR family transcriptional repressor of nem operon
MAGPLCSWAAAILRWEGPPFYAILFAHMQPQGTGQSPTSGAARGSEDGRRLRGARSRARIREAARSLFEERGFDAATLRAIAARAGMGASSIYRHVQSKHELLVLELADLQEEAWLDFRRQDARSTPTRERIQKFFTTQHELLAQRPDLTVIAIRATTYPDSRVSNRVLTLNDRTIGLLAEILQGGRANGDLDPRVDVLSAARALFHGAVGARISWANGLLSERACRTAIEGTVDLLFRGLGRAPTSS